MSFNRIALRHLAASIISVFVLSAAAVAQTAPQQQDFSHIQIKNFGQMDERFFRGGEPKTAADFEALKSLGVATVIDLQAEPEATEKAMVEALGMRYVNIPMVAKKYPREEHVAEFLKLVAEPSTGKFFVHCAGGRHRTGVMGAVYRFNYYGWDYNRVYKEMKDFDFYTAWGHGDFKKFVQDYWQSVQARSTQANTAPAVTAVEAVATDNKH
jgi:protein tyrosine phosphatase (PTP) superfamily phosphohydrolase (DUF442 family)